MKIKIFALALALVSALTLTIGSVSAASAPAGRRDTERINSTAPTHRIDPGDGDADANGSITIEDGVLIFRYSLGLLSENELHLDRCDVNADGVVNMTDATLVLRMVMGIN